MKHWAQMLGELLLFLIFGGDEQGKKASFTHLLMKSRKPQKESNKQSTLANTWSNLANIMNRFILKLKD